MLEALLKRLLEDEGFDGAEALATEVNQVEQSLAEMTEKKVLESSKRFRDAKETLARLKGFQAEIAELQTAGIPRTLPQDAAAIAANAAAVAAAGNVIPKLSLLIIDYDFFIKLMN